MPVERIGFMLMVLYFESVNHPTVVLIPESQSPVLAFVYTISAEIWLPFSVAAPWILQLFSCGGRPSWHV
jgi:hypothetical protein